MNPDNIVREQLVNLLVKRQAHMTFEDAIANFPLTHINTKLLHADYTFWHLLEHLRIAQSDILDYIQNPQYQARPFPEGYWPSTDTTTDETGWQTTIDQFLTDRTALVAIVQDENNDLYTQIPHAATGHNILREINIIAGHNAYHIGEFGIMRQAMNLW